MSHPLAPVTCGDDHGGDPAADYLETIALLQEEVARLEQELQCRERASTEDEAPVPGRPDAGPIDAEARAEVARLEVDLAAREETIGLLMDHLGRVEEAQAASRAEWEQLSGWLAELERRVEGQDGDAILRLEEQLEAERRRADRDRRDAEAEIARLRTALAGDRPAAVEGEAAPTPSGPAPAVEADDARLAEAIAERDALRSTLERLRDERERERLEHAATVAELKAQLSRAAMARPESSDPASTISPAREEQLRFQALRQHLLDIHQREEQERKQKQLIPRLSRLWSRTGPR